MAQKESGHHHSLGGHTTSVVALSSGGMMVPEYGQSETRAVCHDPINLLPVEASLNRSKQHRGPDEWLPPAGQCGYVARFVRVVKLYDLKVSAQESAWFKDFLEKCQKQH